MMLYRKYCIDDLRDVFERHRMQPITSQVGIEFLRTEVETAFVFARVASDAQDSEKRLRNVRNARRAYDTLLHFMQRLVLTPDARDEIHLRIWDLRRQLINLGENC